MKKLIYTFDDFVALFKFRQVSYQDFCRELSVLDISDRSGTFKIRSHIDDFIARVDRNNSRRARLDLFKQKLYQTLVLEPEVALYEWFRRYGELPESLAYYFNIPNTNILSGTTYGGRTHSKYGRICKNINFETFYNTKKLYNNDGEYVIGLMKAMFENFKIRNSLAGPAMFDHICKIENNYGQFWLDFMIGANRASIFNPATYKGIMESVLSGSIIFAPCMGWNAYQIGFYSTNWQHFVATDVIPTVAENGVLLDHEWQAYRDKSVIDLEKKSVDLYLCPSEQLADRHNFDQNYSNQVDAVLFSPPYFDLEIYQSQDQSFTNFPDYQDWLKGYWEATVTLCCEVLKPGGKFAFVISNYRNRAKQEVTISQDMQAVVAKHLSLTGQYRVQWSSIASSRQAHKTRAGNFEDLWVFEKH